MENGFTTNTLRDGFGRMIVKLEACADELNALDAVLGDGDLGVTMVRGARSVQSELDSLPDDVGMAFFKCAQAFTKISGSTLGTLLATGLLSAAKATKGRQEIPWREVSSLLAGAGESMSSRSQGQLGDKTILDALEAARIATEGLDNPAAMANAANEAITSALERFRNQPSRQGRARIFGDKSIGQDDPGMVAFKRILESVL